MEFNRYFFLSGRPFELHGTGKTAYEHFLGSLTPSSALRHAGRALPKNKQAAVGFLLAKAVQVGLLAEVTR